MAPPQAFIVLFKSSSGTLPAQNMSLKAIFVKSQKFFLGRNKKNSYYSLLNKNGKMEPAINRILVLIKASKIEGKRKWEDVGQKDE